MNLVGEGVQRSGGTVLNIVRERVLLCLDEFDASEDSVFDGSGCERETGSREPREGEGRDER